MSEPKILYGIKGRDAAEAEPGMWEVQGVQGNWFPFELAAQAGWTHSYIAKPTTQYRRKQSSIDAAIRAVPLPDGFRLDGPDPFGNYDLIGPNGEGAYVYLPARQSWYDSSEGLELRAKLTRALEGEK